MSDLDRFCPCQVAGTNECSEVSRRCACIRLSPTRANKPLLWAATNDEACLHPIHAAIKDALDKEYDNGYLAASDRA